MNGARLRNSSGGHFPGVPKAPQNASESAQNGRYRLLFDCLEADTFAMAHAMSNCRPDLQWRGRRGLWRASNCPVRRRPAVSAFGPIFLDFKLFCSFLFALTSFPALVRWRGCSAKLPVTGGYRVCWLKATASQNDPKKPNRAQCGD